MTKLPKLFLERLGKILPLGHDIGHCFNKPAHGVFRINTLKITPGEAWAYLDAKGIIYQRLAWYEPVFMVDLELSRQLFNSVLAKEGKIYAQALESLIPVIILDPKPGDHVLDLCAAPGSKTTQIAMHMNNQGILRANEPVKNRFYRLKSVTDLLGAQVRLSMTDGRYMRSHELFDRVLVDAPCSSEGRFIEDDPDSYAYWSVRKIREMAHKQKGLLLNASRLLKPGGVLVYATCTFAPEENEEVVEWFLRKTEGLLELQEIHIPGVPRYSSPMNGCLRVLPGNDWGGFFVAKFKPRSLL